LTDLKQMIVEAGKTSGVRGLVQELFGIDLYPTQSRIVENIAFGKDTRLLLNTYTQYGKSFSIGVGLALRLIKAGGLNESLDVAIIGPNSSDAENVRDDMLEAGLESPLFADMIDTSRGSDPEDLMKSASKSVVTLNDGSIRIECLSASSGSSGKGSGLMGSGADIIVLDESNRVPESVWKENIARMLNTEDAVLIEAGNPFHKDNQFYSHWVSDEFKCFHVGEEKGIKENRHSKSFFDGKASDVGGRESLEYKVLYRSEFPDQVDDALIAHSWVEKAKKESFDLEDSSVVYGLDVAGEGDDKIVLTRVEKENGKINVTDQWSKAYSSDTGDTAYWAEGKIQDDDCVIVVDSVGIGAGVYSKLNELGFECVKFKAGEKPLSEGDRFQNKKARNFFKLRDALQEGDVMFSEGFSHGKNSLVHELTHIKTERRARDKIKIVDPDSGSPDFADSLMMAFYENTRMRNKKLESAGGSVSMY